MRMFESVEIPEDLRLRRAAALLNAEGHAILGCAKGRQPALLEQLRVACPDVRVVRETSLYEDVVYLHLECAPVPEPRAP